MSKKNRKWFKPLSDFDDCGSHKKIRKVSKDVHENSSNKAESLQTCTSRKEASKMDQHNWIKSFDPLTVEDLAIHNKKIQEVDEWLSLVSKSCNSDMLLMTGPVGCGKTITLDVLAKKHNMKVTEWITPLDIEIPSEYGDYEYKEKQSTKFLDFIINAANFTSLLDGNSNKLVLVEDFPNTFLRTPAEFTDILYQYKIRARSPIVFICSETHTDNKKNSVNVFTPALKDQFKITHIAFNSVSTTGLRSALKRVSEIINKKHTLTHNIPSTDMIECVVNSSTGDVRSAVLNLHFACLKGSYQKLETSSIIEKENRSKTTKKKKQCKYSSIGKNETVSILHGVGRVLNPKVVSVDGIQKFTHDPQEIMDQFISQPTLFVNFLEENYLPHFSSADYVDNAASALSDADCMLAEWREKVCQEYGLYTAVAGLMLANKAPVSSWNPVRGPKNMKIQYPFHQELPQLQKDLLYKGKVLVTDYQTYCKIIGNCCVATAEVD